MAMSMSHPDQKKSPTSSSSTAAAGASASGGCSEDRNPNFSEENRRNRCLVGDLPLDFLRVDHLTSALPRGAYNYDKDAAIALHHQLNPSQQYAKGMGGQFANGNIRGRLLISIMQAKLVKNYGMTRMDPYIRIHIGHNIYETPTDVNGSKNPKWNKTIQCFLPNGIQQIYLEIYDECSFSVDELIGHAYIKIPEEVFKGNTNEDWYNLDGRQGDGKEGQILLVFSFMPFAQNSPQMPGAQGMVVQHQQSPHKRSQQQVMPQQPQPQTVEGMRQSPEVFNEQQLPPALTPEEIEAIKVEDLKLLKEMFPNISEDVVLSVYEASGSKDSAVNALLSMSD